MKFGEAVEIMRSHPNLTMIRGGRFTMRYNPDEILRLRFGEFGIDGCIRSMRDDDVDGDWKILQGNYPHDRIRTLERDRAQSVILNRHRRLSLTENVRRAGVCHWPQSRYWNRSTKRQERGQYLTR